MKATTTTIRTTKCTLPPNTFTVGGKIYPMSQFEEVTAALAGETPLPKPSQQYSCSVEEYLYGS
jgi:hypothetical protein